MTVNSANRIVDCSVAVHFVCLWHKADMPAAPIDVRFWG